MSAPSIIVITGPTASGKTRMSIEVAKKLGGEIVNADSVQVYKDFNIAAAKPSKNELAQVPHHLISEVDPRNAFDTEQFCQLAHAKIKEIAKRGRVPIVSGGTGLYLRSLLCGLVEVEPVDSQLKFELEMEITQLREVEKEQDKISEHLHSILNGIDSASAQVIHSHDIQRIKRAILVYRATGKSLIGLQEEHAHGSPQYRALVMVLTPNREELNKKINARVGQMIDIGLIDEVRSLLSRYPLNARPFGAIGYRHVAEYLRGDYGFDKMVETLKRDTRRFAKRQRTWWRNQPRFLGWENVTASFLEGAGGKSEYSVIQGSVIQGSVIQGSVIEDSVIEDSVTENSVIECDVNENDVNENNFVENNVMSFLGEFLKCPTNALEETSVDVSNDESLENICLENPAFSKDRDTRKIYFFEYDRL